MIGFEISALVFLTLTRSPAEALVVWALGQIASQTFCLRATAEPAVQRRRHRARRRRLRPDPLDRRAGQRPQPVLARRDQPGLRGVLPARPGGDRGLAGAGGPAGRSTCAGARPWLPLLVFVAVSTIGFLAAVLLDPAPRWTLGLLLVPIATILVAVRSVSESRLSQMRLGGLLDAATKAPDWADPGSIERALIEQAERVLRHSVAELRDAPPGQREIGHQLEVPGQRPALAGGPLGPLLGRADRPRRRRPGRADRARRGQPEPAPADRRDGLPGPARRR